MLCAAVLSGHIKIPELIVMSSDALASKETRQIRQQVKEEAIKNVVISNPAPCITSELAKMIAVESTTTKFKSSKNDVEPEKVSSSSVQQIKDVDSSSASRNLLQASSSSSSQSNELKLSLTSLSTPPIQKVGKDHMALPLRVRVNEIDSPQRVLSPTAIPFDSIGGADGKFHFSQKTIVDSGNLFLPSPVSISKNPSPPILPSNVFSSSPVPSSNERKRHIPKEHDRPSPLLSPPEHDTNASNASSPSPPTTSPAHGHHISSQSGTDYFSITISRLKTSFTTKMFIDQSCQWELNGFLPYSLVEKGRIRLDEFNKFISDSCWTTD